MDCYDEILSIYNSNKTISDLSIEHWVNYYYIKLMRSYLKDRNILYIKNCLILLLNLFVIEPPDFYFNIGKTIDELTKVEEVKFLELMKSEFLN